MMRRETSHLLLSLWLSASYVGMAASSAAGPPLLLRVTHASPLADGKANQSTATALPGETCAVTVACHDMKSESLQLGNRIIPVEETLHDPVSRLEFLALPPGQKLPAVPWNTQVGENANAALRVLGPEGPVPCQSTGWVKHVDGKVLPFALLNVDFHRSVPSPGTPVVDAQGAVVGIVYQAAETGNIGYVIPAEAILRVRHDLAEGETLIRGWLGLALHTGVQVPQISRILAESPAAEAGIQVGDVIQSIDSRKISDYADAANAFFYIIPGKPVSMTLQRGEQTVKVTLTPTKPPADL